VPSGHRRALYTIDTPLTIVGEFAFKHCRNFVKRIFYNYFLRSFSIASVNLVAGLALLISIGDLREQRAGDAGGPSDPHRSTADPRIPELRHGEHAECDAP
jgi:hypothetical protein